jgi:hypothetical protein
MAKKNTANPQTEWDYAASPESTSHIRLEKKYQLFIICLLLNLKLTKK